MEHTESFPFIPFTIMCIPSPIIHFPHFSSAFVSIDELILTHYPPKSIIYLRVHSQCCIVYGLGQVYNDTYLSALPIHPPSPKPLATIDIFTVFIVLPFPEYHIIGILQYIALSGWLLLLEKTFSLSFWSSTAHFF